MAGLRPASPRMMPVRAPPRSLNYYVLNAVTKALSLVELMERVLLINIQFAFHKENFSGLALQPSHGEGCPLLATLRQGFEDKTL